MSRIERGIGPHRSDFLALEYAASAAYNEFAYQDRAQADAVREFLLDRGVAEFSSDFSALLLDEGAVRGMISCLAAEEVAKCRMKSAFALGKWGIFENSPRLYERLALAGQTLMKLGPGDFYVSRIATAPVSSGKGYGGRLLDHCEERARAAGAVRIALEVAAQNAGAVRFYEKHCFAALERQSVSSPDDGRSLDYIHMAKDLRS